jgi:hypothetical protein
MNIIIQKGFNYGDVVIFKLHLPDENHIDFTNYHLSKQMHERCFNTAGLTNILCHNMEISAEDVSLFEEPYWQDLLKCEPVIVIS